MLLPARQPMYLALIWSRGPAPKQAIRIPTRLLKALSECEVADIIRRRYVLTRLPVLDYLIDPISKCPLL